MIPVRNPQLPGIRTTFFHPRRGHTLNDNISGRSAHSGAGSARHHCLNCSTPIREQGDDVSICLPSSFDAIGRRAVVQHCPLRVGQH